LQKTAKLPPREQKREDSAGVWRSTQCQYDHRTHGSNEPDKVLFLALGYKDKDIQALAVLWITDVACLMTVFCCAQTRIYVCGNFHLLVTRSTVKYAGVAFDIE